MSIPSKVGFYLYKWFHEWCSRIPYLSPLNFQRPREKIGISSHDKKDNNYSHCCGVAQGYNLQARNYYHNNSPRQLGNLIEVNCK